MDSGNVHTVRETHPGRVSGTRIQRRNGNKEGTDDVGSMKSDSSLMSFPRATDFRFVTDAPAADCKILEALALDGSLSLLTIEPAVSRASNIALDELRVVLSECVKSPKQLIFID